MFAMPPVDIFMQAFLKQIITQQILHGEIAQGKVCHRHYCHRLSPLKMLAGVMMGRSSSQ